MKSRTKKTLFAPQDFTSEDIEEYIKDNSLKKNPLYGKAYDCWCSAYKSPADKNLEFFQRFAEADAKLRKGGSGLFYNHQKAGYQEGKSPLLSCLDCSIITKKTLNLEKGAHYVGL